MAVKRFKPTSPGRRFATVSTFEEITKKEPEKSLLAPLKKNAGRNSGGRITVRHRGGGHKRSYRIIDFKRNKDDVPARVAGIEYDPNRSVPVLMFPGLYLYRQKEAFTPSFGLHTSIKIPGSNLKCALISV